MTNMNALTIEVIPYNLTNLTVGEYRQLQILTNANKYKVVIDNEDIVSYDEIHKEVYAIAEGRTYINFIALDDEDKEKANFSVNIKIVEENKNKQLRYMFHNRNTNRLNTVVYGEGGTEDMSYKLPAMDGTLLTRELYAEGVAMIAKPTITTPKYNAKNVEGYMECTDYETLLGFIGECEGSFWEFALDEDFKQIIDTREIIREPKNRCPVIHTLQPVYVRVRYVSGKVMSSPSAPVYYIPKNIGRDSLKELKTGDSWIGYFGIVPHSELIDNRDYRGNYDTLIKYGLKTFKAGQSVHKVASDGTETLYYTLKDVPADNAVLPEWSIENKEGSWAVDDRENLPTPRWVNEITGIGMGFNDNNADGYSSGATGVGAMVDHTLGWLKYVYKGKLCYTPVKPICTQVCWNDIAKRDIAYGERTFRAGTQMYRIRLMRTDEFLTIIPKLMNGDLANFKNIDLGLVDPTTATTGRACWLEDYQEGAKRKLGDHTGTKILEADPKMRTGGLAASDGITTWLMSYRPVIELVTEYDEPWRNWPLCPTATNEKFQYDKYTDTGYFGTIPASNFITGDALAQQLNLTAGNSINSNTEWFKFYWHGMVLFVGKNGIRRVVCHKDLLDAYCWFPYNLGYDKSIDLDIGGLKYNYGMMSGAKYSLLLHTDYGKYDLGQYSQYNELIYRVHAGYIDNTNIYNDGGYVYAGPQIGDNWTEYTLAETYVSGIEQLLRDITTDFNSRTSGTCRFTNGHQEEYLGISAYELIASNGNEGDDDYIPLLKLKPNPIYLGGRLSLYSKSIKIKQELEYYKGLKQKFLNALQKFAYRIRDNKLVKWRMPVGSRIMNWYSGIYDYPIFTGIPTYIYSTDGTNKRRAWLYSDWVVYDSGSHKGGYRACLLLSDENGWEFGAMESHASSSNFLLWASPRMDYEDYTTELSNNDNSVIKKLTNGELGKWFQEFKSEVPDLSIDVINSYISELEIELKQIESLS